jgi:hypothetical protein
MKRLAILIVTALFLLQSPAIAAPKVAAGATCTKVGATQVVGGKKFTCIKSGKKTVWDKGVASKKSQTITADPVADVEVSASFFQVNVKASSGLIIQTNSTTPQVCQVNLLLIVVISKVGKCSLTFTQTGNSSFAAATPLVLTFNVTKMKQEISTSDDAELEIIEKTQSISWQASSGLDVTLTSLTPRICTVLGDTLTLLGLGTCEIQGTQAGNDEYLPAAPFTFKYQLVRAKQEIEFDRIDDVGLEEMYVELEAYSSADDKNIKPKYTTSTPKVCVIEEDRVQLLAAGDCTVLASHPGTDLYGPAPEVSQTFKVLPPRVGSLENPATPGVTIRGTESEITFIEYTEKVDMKAFCKEDSFYEGCTEDKNFNGIPDPDTEYKMVALLFEYKNIGKTAENPLFYFSAVYEDEFIDASSATVPRDLTSKKLLPNAKARGYVYISVPTYFEMKDVLLYFESFDEDANDVYIAVTKP